MKKITARVLHIVQYEVNPKTGKSLNFGEENIKKMISRKSVKRYGYIRHDRDKYDATDMEKHIARLKDEYTSLTSPDCSEADYIQRNQYIFEGNLKPPHWHLVMESPNKIDVDMVARTLGIPSNCIDIPKGHGAFLDCIAYLNHGDESSVRSGKTLYSQSDVIANFDWVKEVQTRKDNIDNYGRPLTPVEQMFMDVSINGMTLKECKNTYPVLYQKNISTLTKLRLDYLHDQAPPANRVNFYISGLGGTGKDLLSRALARSLFPQYENDEDIFFIVGAGNVLFEGYDGQPVLIWSERRAAGLLKTLGGRENVFSIFETHPTKQRQNVKFGSVNLCNTINIVNGQENYDEFLNGLAGEYKDRYNEFHKAEDKGQSYRRFPFVINVHDSDFDFWVNKGYYENKRALFQEYIEYNGIRGNMQQIVLACGSEDDSKAIASMVLKPIVDVYNEVFEKHKSQKISTDDIMALMIAEGWGTQANSPTGGLVASATPQSLEITQGDCIMLSDEEAAELPF